MSIATRDRIAGAKDGAVAGLVVGIVLAVLAEAGAAIIRETAYMADVGIVGFTAVFGLPAAVALGALLGWWSRPRSRRMLALAVAAPAGLAAVGHVAIQALSV